MAPNGFISGKMPFVAYTAALATGVVLTGIVHNSGADLFMFLLIAAVLLLLIVKNFGSVYSAWYASVYRFVFLLTLIFAGAFYNQLHHEKLFDEKLPESGFYTGRIEEKDLSDDQRIRYRLQLLSFGKDTIIPLDERIVLFLSDSSINQRSKPGDLLAFWGRLYPIKKQINPGSFDYQRFMYRRGIRYQAYVKKADMLPRSSHTISTYALMLRNHLLTMYRDASIEGPSFAVLAALTLGEKSSLDQATRTSFAASGAMHVLAVSGLHVGIIYWVIGLLLKPLERFRKGRLPKCLITLLLLWCYAFMAGLSPSVMRASVMFSFVVIGENLHRKTNIYNTLALSAFVLILINPLIIYEVGFQLSYAAVTAIVFFQPKIVSVFKIKQAILRYLWELSAVSLAAQVGTFALSIYYFHQFPVYFLLTNLLVIPLAGVIIYSAFAFFITSIVPPLHLLFAFLLKVETSIMIKGIEWIEQLPAALIANIWIDQFTLISLFLLIIAIASTMQGHRLIRLQPVLIASIFLLVLLNVKLIKQMRQSMIIVYQTYDGQLMSLIHGRDHFYYCDSDSISRHQQILLENSTGYYGTSEPISLSNNQTDPDFAASYNSILFFKNIRIEVSESAQLAETETIEKDAIWLADEGKVLVKNSEKIRIRTIKNSNLTSSVKSDSIGQKLFDVNTFGAIIIEERQAIKAISLLN